MNMFDMFMEKLKSEGDPDKINPEEFERQFSKFIDSSAELLHKLFLDNAAEHLNSKAADEKEFIKNHHLIWGEGLNKLEVLIDICIDAGSNFNKERKRGECQNEDFLLQVLVRLHAKCCAIANEILFLLKGGYADAAQARWRALHETNVTLRFISKHGADCAERFIDHEIIDSYNGMKIHKKYEHRLQAKGPTLDEVEAITHAYKKVIKKYGRDFEHQYGWISVYFPGNNKPGFQSMEKDVALDHMRPYFKWASQNIHTSFKTITKALTLPEFNPEIINVGPSNYGLVDPAHSTALSLAQATSFLLMFASDTESVVLMKVLMLLSDDIGLCFLKISNSIQEE